MPVLEKKREKVERKKFPGSYSVIKQGSVGPEKKKFHAGLVVFSSRPDFEVDRWFPHEQLGSKWL